MVGWNGVVGGGPESTLWWLRGDWVVCGVPRARGPGLAQPARCAGARGPAARVVERGLGGLRRSHPSADAEG